jgi:cytochrome c oxidase subunit 2
MSESNGSTMQTDVPLFPEQASTFAPEVDKLYYFLVGVAFFFSTLILLLIVYLAFRYRRNARVDRSRAPTGSLTLEIIWSVIPLVIVMISFGWGAKLFVDTRRPPRDAIEVQVVGKQWMWRVHHEDGRREINSLHVPVGQPVLLRMISEDVIHSFFIPAFRIKQDVLPGRYLTMWFEPTRVGEYHLFCAEYCGTSHSLMRGTVYVQTPEEYARWLADSTAEPAEVVGRRVFERHRCGSCHERESTERGPALHGLFGRTVELQDGQRVTADMQYLRESLLDPGAKIVAGYRNLMPTYQQQLSEEEILQLAAYIRDLDE